MLSKFFNRRDVFKTGGLLALLPGFRSSAWAAGPLRSGPGIYQSIGVRPLINCKGTFTIISGSQSLPEVKAAMEAASRHYVHLDELMEAVGTRLAELTGAEWGMVSNGCAAALAHTTAACIAGSDPEKLQRLPDTTGLKNEVISPAYSRNVYDHAIRGAGAKFVTVNSRQEYERAFTSRTAMVMVLAGNGDSGPLGLEVLAPIAKAHGVPVLVDAAAERLTIPNVHLRRGATLVAYSGGKCLRGPQAAGLLLGDKKIIQAAWIHSAPHHAYGRPMKAGKEEIMGMLAAVEAWVKRDHKAEWKDWESWLDQITASVTRVKGVTTRVVQPDSLSNNAPRLVIEWDPSALGITGADVEKTLLDGDPRIILGGSSGSRRSGGGRSSLTIMPYMMMPGDAKIAAQRIHAVLSNPPKVEQAAKAAPAADLTGQWNVHVQYGLGESHHRMAIDQKDGGVSGFHEGEFLNGDIRGSVNGDEFYARSSHRYEGTRIGYEFTGKISGGKITGSVDLGEYGRAQFVAQRASAR